MKFFSKFKINLKYDIKKVNIGSNMRAVLLTYCIKNPLTGIGRYTLELVRQFDAMNSGVSFVGGLAEKSKFFEAQRESNKRKYIVDLPKKIIKSSQILTNLYSSVKDCYQEFQLRKYKDCIVHSPNFYLPHTKSKTVVTIHDLSMFLYPECFEFAAAKMMQMHCQKSIQHADALITVSYSVRDQICEMFNYPRSNIFVTPLASGKDFHPRVKNDCFSVLNNYDLRYQSYVLVVGTVEPRKNLMTLIKAYSCLPEKIRKTCPLVVVGFSGWKSVQEHCLIRSSTEAGWLKYLSYVKEEDIVALYSAAKLFCFPSKYEGFGLPMVEAMNSGVPVLCSDIPVFREVGEAAPAYIAYNDVDKWKECILRYLMDDKLLALMREKSLAQGAKFSWSKCSMQTLDAYAKILGN